MTLKELDTMLIGCHISTKGNLVKMIKSAIKLEINTFQYFTRNPRGGSARKYLESEINEYKSTLSKSSIKSVVAHLPYTVNLASSTKRTRNFGKQILFEDLRRSDLIDSNYLVMHPGSHVKNTVDEGIDFIAEGLEFALDSYTGDTIICLETMSGKGTEIGRSLDEIEKILNKVNWHKKIGVCLDSCHLFAAGYDFTNKLEVNRLMKELDQKIGLDRVYLTHLNDSKKPLASNKDRHANIGKGLLGIEGIKNYLTNSYISKIPVLLETPVENEADYLEEIKLIRSVL